mgnify:CR=1 FL=1
MRKISDEELQSVKALQNKSGRLSAEQIKKIGKVLSI